MRQDFTNVSGQQIAELFPILLEQHNPQWKERYLREEEYLKSVFGDKLSRISHIGSTAVKGLIAKPTIDILLEIYEPVDLSPMSSVLLDAGYVINTPARDIIMYIKGYTPSGFEGQAVHVHVRKSADWGELYFRDYLIAHTKVACEYGKLKLNLGKQYTYDREGYTAAKGDFITKHTDRAMLEFLGKYIPE